MTRLGAAVLVAAALAVPAAPARAHHTICDGSEPSDVWVQPAPGLGAGADLDERGAFHACVDDAAVVVRTDPAGVVVCSRYTPDGDPSDDVCVPVTAS